MPTARHTGLIKCQKVFSSKFFHIEVVLFFVKSQIINKLNMTAK